MKKGTSARVHDILKPYFIPSANIKAKNCLSSACAWIELMNG